MFDTDKDGKISLDEFKYAMINMGERMEEDEVNEIIHDSRELINDNNITIEEFARMVMNKIWISNQDGFEMLKIGCR